MLSGLSVKIKHPGKGTSVLEGIKRSHIKFNAIPGLWAEQTLCAKHQAVVTVSFGSLQKVEEENKILGFSDNLFLQAGLFFRGLLIVFLVFKEL